MKTVATGLRDHLDSEVTALCTCWEITRKDGLQYLFTDAANDVKHEGNTYLSVGAYRRSAIETTSSLAVDNLEIVGATNDLILPENELRSGLFDGAEIKVFVASWMGAVIGNVKMRRGSFGEVQILKNGTFKVELRGILQNLSHIYTDIFTPSCLYDLGEPDTAAKLGCGIPILPPEVQRSTTYVLGDTVIANTGTLQGGATTPIEIGDPSFELAGVTGLAASDFWNDEGAVPAVLSTVQAHDGTYSVRGGTGATSVVQRVDLISDDVTIDDIDSGAVYATVSGWRLDENTDEGNFSGKFLDDEGLELGIGLEVFADGGGEINPTSVSYAGDFTLEFWFYANSLPAFNNFYTITDGANDSFWFDFNGRFRFDIAGASFGETPWEINRWYHVAVTRSGTTLKLYKDWVEVGSNTYATNYNITRFLTGSGGSSPADIVIDELRFWTTVRTQQELHFYGDRSIDPASSGLNRYYTFNDGTFDDQTGNDVATPANFTTQKQTSPVAVRAADTPTAAGFTTGSEDVGTSWVERRFTNMQVPTGTRYLEILFSASVITGPDSESYFDNVSGHLVNTNEPKVLISAASNLYFECTTAGTTAAVQPAYPTAVSTPIADGSATFTSRNAWTRAGHVTLSEGSRVFNAVITESRAVDGWFNGGLVTFESGENAGVSMEVKNWTNAVGEVELYLSMPNTISPGDIFSIYPGCDKSRISCAAIFYNIEKFSGTPDVPGQDELYRYPDAR